MRLAACLRPLALTLLPGLAAACGGGGTGSPVTLLVSTLADAGPGSLRQVVEDAPDRAIVRFEPALAGGTVHLASPILVSKPLTIDGTLPGGDVTLDGDGVTRHFQVHDTSGVLLAGLVLVDGRAFSDGGSIRAENVEIRLERVRILDCEADHFGGGLFALDSGVEMDTCHVSACTAWFGGGLFLGHGESRVLHSSLLANSAVGGPGGGIVLSGGEHVLRSTTLRGNLAGGGGPAFDLGGAIFAAGSGTSGPFHLGIYGCTITGNGAAAEGGGVSAASQTVQSRIDCRQSIVAGNLAPTDPDVGIGAMITVASAWNVVGALAGGPIWNGLDGNVVGDPFTPVDPVLGAPVPGPTGTYYLPLLAGSPARDLVPHAESLDESGDPLVLDQVFASRTADAAADAGAVERP